MKRSEKERWARARCGQIFTRTSPGCRFVHLYTTVAANQRFHFRTRQHGCRLGSESDCRSPEKDLVRIMYLPGALAKRSDRAARPLSRGPAPGSGFLGCKPLPVPLSIYHLYIGGLIRTGSF